MAAMHKLTATKVAKLSTPGRYNDGKNLVLQIIEYQTKKKGPQLSKAWLFRYMLNGRKREMGLGPVDIVSLAEAREKARQARALLLEGIDPIEARNGRRLAALAEAAKQITFKAAAEQYIADQRAGWKNEKHGAQWSATLEKYAFPVIGDLPVNKVELPHIVKILKPIWTKKTETASRLRGRIEAVLGWATVHGYRKGDNPARWRGHLDKLLPAKNKVQKVKHHDAMPYSEVPAFMLRLRENDSVSARALEFTILTAARTSETIGARWDEIDLKEKLWTVPADRIKAGREHRVPLSDRCVDILADIPREGDDTPVFPGIRPGRGLSNMAMLQLARAMTDNGYTVHGFRSSFRDWAAERTNFPHEIAEAALAHIVGDRAERAYLRSDALDKRRRLMAAWAGYCEGPDSRASKVTPLRKAKR